MNNSQRAVSMFKKGFSCSQAILSSFGEELHLDRNTALKIAEAFGTDMGRIALTRGAVTEAFMVIGLKYGRISAGDFEAKQKTTELVKEFIRKFKERNEAPRAKARGFLERNTERPLFIRTLQGAVFWPRMYKSITCKDLIGHDISTNEGFEYAKKNDIMNDLCPKLVADAAIILEEIL